MAVEENLSVAEDIVFPSSKSYEKDGLTITEEYKINESGKKVKVIRKAKKELVEKKVHKAVAERSKWKKFGQASSDNANGPDPSTTNIGEHTVLKLSSNLGRMDENVAIETLKKQGEGTNRIKCRYCKGDHFSHTCPVKDQAVPSSEEVKSPIPSQTAGKYVPMHLRNGSAGSSETRNRAEEFSLRVTNLPPETVDQDVRELFSKFGDLSRVYMAKDRNGDCKGFAFVSFHDKSDAERALEKVNGRGYRNLILKVEWSVPKSDL